MVRVIKCGQDFIGLRLRRIAENNALIIIAPAKCHSIQVCPTYDKIAFGTIPFIYLTIRLGRSMG